MFWVVSVCAWSFCLLYVDVGSVGQFGCFRLFHVVLASCSSLYLVYCCLRFFLCFKLVQFVPGFLIVFLIVLGCVEITPPNSCASSRP